MKKPLYKRMDYRALVLTGIMVYLLILIFVSSIVFGDWPYQHKPMLGQQVDRSHPCAKGLVGFWLMNEGTGNRIQDLSGNRITGTLVADTHFVPGKFGSALGFDGTGDYVSIGQPQVLTSGITDKLTLVASYNPSTSPRTEVIASRWSDNKSWQIYLLNSKLIFQVMTTASKSVICTTTITAGNQYFCVGVYDGAAIHIYMNGVLDATPISVTGNLVNDSQDIEFGRNDSGSNYCLGKLSYVLIYNRALSASEIAQLYQKPFCFMADDLPVSMMYDYSGAAPSGQVIFIQFSAIPILFITTFLLIRKRRRYVE